MMSTMVMVKSMYLVYAAIVDEGYKIGYWYMKHVYDVEVSYTLNYIVCMAFFLSLFHDSLSHIDQI